MHMAQFYKIKQPCCMSPTIHNGSAKLRWKRSVVCGEGKTSCSDKPIQADNDAEAAWTTIPEQQKLSKQNEKTKLVPQNASLCNQQSDISCALPFISRSKISVWEFQVSSLVDEELLNEEILRLLPATQNSSHVQKSTPCQKVEKTSTKKMKDVKTCKHSSTCLQFRS